MSQKNNDFWATFMICHDLQTPDVVEISYEPPPEESRNGQITVYDIVIWKSSSPDEKRQRSTTEQKTVFTDLEEDTQYMFSVRATTRKGYGPWSTQVSFRTDRNVVRAPEKVRAMATSDSSIEVWWEAVPLRTKVIGYYIYYSMTKGRNIFTITLLSICSINVNFFFKDQ